MPLYYNYIIGYYYYTDDNYKFYLQYFESECTYFNIDLHNLGYTNKFINPEVRVGYNIYYLYKAKYFIPSFKHIANYFWMYFVTLLKMRNKLMYNYHDRNIKLEPALEKWYIENKLNG